MIWDKKRRHKNCNLKIVHSSITNINNSQSHENHIKNSNAQHGIKMPVYSSSSLLKDKTLSKYCVWSKDLLLLSTKQLKKIPNQNKKFNLKCQNNFHFIGFLRELLTSWYRDICGTLTRLYLLYIYLFFILIGRRFICLP